MYDCYDAEDKAGNVRRVARKVADVPGPDPVNWSVEATDFEYHRNGEVRMIIQRTWHESGTTVTGDQLVSIHEVRGNGRRRHMLRPWNFQSDGQGGWTLSPDNASALWTVYDGDEPTADYRIIDGDGPGFTGDLEKSYTLGLAQRTGEGEVKYFHTDHLGTTQAMTDASQTPEPRIVYTAFGEVISTSTPPDSRYQYAGKHGYESFDTLPFIHVGARWYDPASGRFLQRDPFGIRGGPNVYAYAKLRPTSYIDPFGFEPELNPKFDQKWDEPNVLRFLLRWSGGEDESFLDRWADRLSARGRASDVAAAGGVAAAGRYFPRRKKIGGSKTRTSSMWRVALHNRGYVRLGKAASVCGGIAAGVGGFYEVYVLAEEGIYAWYDIPLGEY